MPGSWRHHDLKDQALQETGYLLTAFLDPEALGILSCVSHTWTGPSSSFDWAGRCQADFGAVCLQYLRYLALEKSGWRSLYLRLRAFHRQLDSFPACLQRRVGPEAWRNTSAISLKKDDCRLVQGGHTVLFCGDAEHVRIIPTTTTAPVPHRYFRPADFLDVVPVTTHDIVGVSTSLYLERWRFYEKATCKRRSPTGLQQGDCMDDLRLFVEHVAAMLFLFAGVQIHAFDLASLEKSYVVSASSWERREEQLLARWEYGDAFVAYQVEGREACVWSTSLGTDLGKITSHFQLLCCDITNLKAGKAGKAGGRLVATLEADGGVRVFTSGSQSNQSNQWQLVEAVQALSLVVEVKLERHLLMAVSHSEDGAGTSGTVHVWQLAFVDGHDGHAPGPCLQNYCKRDFSQPPDRVEARHGGRFIEVQFLSEGSTMDGIYDVEWLEPAKLHPLLVLKRCIGDWRCDLRDAVAVLDANDENAILRWLFLWPPLPANSEPSGHSWMS